MHYGNASAATPPLFSLPNELVNEVVRRVQEPWKLVLVCKQFYESNWVWWLVFELKTSRRGWRYNFESSQVSSAQNADSFWIAMEGEQAEGEFRPEKDYRSLSGVSGVVPRSKLYGGWAYDLDWTKLLLAPIPHSKRWLSGKAFGGCPVLFVCSSCGSGWMPLTMKLPDCEMHPIIDQVNSQLGVSQPSDFIGTNGWPGWEQMTGTTGNLQVLGIAYGGSDPPGRLWHRYAGDHEHVMATYKNMV